MYSPSDLLFQRSLPKLDHHPSSPTIYSLSVMHCYSTSHLSNHSLSSPSCLPICPLCFSWLLGYFLLNYLSLHPLVQFTSPFIFFLPILCTPSYLSHTSPLLPSAIPPFPRSVSTLLSCNPQFTGFPGHIVASQRKLAQHSAVNNWRGPTWPGTLSLNGLFWERSMLACESFIRACRWNVQGHRQCSPLSVLIPPCSSVTFSAPPSSPRLNL